MNSITVDKYIEIKNLSKPEKALERLENGFNDIMYTHHFSESSLIMLLDVNIDPYKEGRYNLAKESSGHSFTGNTRPQYFLVPFIPKQK